MGPGILFIGGVLIAVALIIGNSIKNRNIDINYRFRIDNAMQHDEIIDFLKKIFKS